MSFSIEKKQLFIPFQLYIQETEPLLRNHLLHGKSQFSMKKFRLIHAHGNVETNIIYEKFIFVYFYFRIIIAFLFFLFYLILVER